VLDELNSAQTIIKILQNELLSSKVSVSMCAEDQFHTERLSSKPDMGIRTSAIPKNNTVKALKEDKHIRAKSTLFSSHFSSSNQITRLSNPEGVPVQYCGIQESSEHCGTQKSSEQSLSPKGHKTMTHQINDNKIPTIVNGIPNFYGEFRSTTFNSEETSTKKCQQVKTMKTQIVKSSNLVKHKVLIIGDSPTRKSASLMQDNLDIDYRVSSFVKPGAQMNDITKSAKEELKSLKSEDLLVICGGANDISRNNTKKALNLMSEFVNEHNELNIVIINSPYRHDLDLESCVNQEVTKFNRLVKKIMELQSKVKVLELNLDRSHFTTHGSHLNSRGKELVSQKLALIVQHILKKKQIVTIPISWKNPPLVETNTESQVLNVNDEKIKSVHSLQNRRNCPARRNLDFFRLKR
jgi:hypothetical protein